MNLMPMCRILKTNQILSSLDWTSVASISTRKEIAGYPFSNVFSVSDGANLKEASGVPYFYLSRLEMTVQDWQVMRKIGIN